MEALGATVDINEDSYYLEADELKGTEMLLDEASVTATENAIMAASVAKGETTIENAACEPHVQALCHFLSRQGILIEGIGSNRLIIKGIENYKNLSATEPTISPDYLEIGGFISMAALTNGI